jgi:Flp pilus assembly pilin Flp
LAAPQTAAAIEQQFAVEGFRPGAPRHITAQSQAIDRLVCRRLKCPACRKRGCDYRPFTDGRAYRVLACCQACGAAEEMVEYAVMLALIIVVCITAITTLGTNANNTFSYVSTQVGSTGS